MSNNYNPTPEECSAALLRACNEADVPSLDEEELKRFLAVREAARLIQEHVVDRLPQVADTDRRDRRERIMCGLFATMDDDSEWPLDEMAAYAEKVLDASDALDAGVSP